MLPGTRVPSAARDEFLPTYRMCAATECCSGARTRCPSGARATCSMQRATCSIQHTTYNILQRPNPFRYSGEYQAALGTVRVDALPASPLTLTLTLTAPAAPASWTVACGGDESTPGVRDCTVIAAGSSCTYVRACLICVLACVDACVRVFCMLCAALRCAALRCAAWRVLVVCPGSVAVCLAWPCR